MKEIFPHGNLCAYFFSKNKKRGDYFHREVMKMAGANGGIRYATENDYDFTTSPSVAGTAWFIFYEMKLNPFKPGRKTRRAVKKYLNKCHRPDAKK